MNRWSAKFIILIAAFAVGVGLASFRERRIRKSPTVTFSPDGMVSAFRSHYHSSDGQFLSYACYEFESPTAAEEYLHDEIRPNYKYVGSTPVRIVERIDNVDASGNKIGERAVLDNGDIYWTDGARLHLIYAPSVEYARLFENSETWTWEGCWKVPRHDKTF